MVDKPPLILPPPHRTDTILGDSYETPHSLSLNPLPLPCPALYC